MDIKAKIYLTWNAHLEQICFKECEYVFGENWKGLTIPRCSEEEFRQWWKTYSPKEYNSYYYEVATFIWDSAEINHLKKSHIWKRY